MVIEGDILSITEGIIVHQVNAIGVMGAGLALQIRNKWPHVYRIYYMAYLNHELKLGHFIAVSVQVDKLYVVNLVGQSGVGKGQTNYGAHKVAWPKINKWAKVLHPDLTVYAPFGIGCGLGGGDWKIMQPLVEELCSVTWVKKP